MFRNRFRTTQMWPLLWALPLLLNLFILGCGEDLPTEPSTKSSLPGVVTLGVGQSVSFGPDDLTLRFSTVTSDSRCPTGAVCIWQGEGVIELSMRSGNRSEQPRLSTLTAQTHPNRVEFADFSVTLLDLAPYPEVGQLILPTAYVARLSVARR